MAKTLVYQIYLFGFLNQEGGLSAIASATQHLHRVKALGATHVWVGPIFPSPWKDHGYDVADYFAIDPRFGTIEEFEGFVSQAHSLGLEVLIDLVLNHTSTQHKWFQSPKFRQKYYCWSVQDHPGWRNLFNQGPAWQYHEGAGQYYCHLFHEDQADLNWFTKGPGGDINLKLVQRFHSVIDFWMLECGVDGFRLDVPQSINKNFEAKELELADLLNGEQAARVLNAVFGDTECFLIMECFDPTMGELVQYYSDNTPVDFVLNVMLKDQISRGEAEFLQLIDQSTRNPHFMLDLESHDSPRFPSREGVTPEDAIWCLFNSGTQGICLYQGQELGLSNPTEVELPDYKLLDLDAQTAMRFRSGELIRDLRPTSRANARIPLPLEEYARQEQNPSSYLSLTKHWIARWQAS